VTSVGDGVGEFSWATRYWASLGSRFEPRHPRRSPDEPADSKASALSWEVAGSLYVVGCTAYAAVRAIDVKEGETVAVSAAAGESGPSSCNCWPCTRRRSSVSHRRDNAEWLIAHEPSRSPTVRGSRAAAGRRAERASCVHRSLRSRVRAARGRHRDPSRPHRDHHLLREGSRDRAKAKGSGDASTTEVLTEMADLVPRARSRFPSPRTYPLDKVVDAFEQLETAPHPRKDRPDPLIPGQKASCPRGSR